MLRQTSTGSLDGEIQATNASPPANVHSRIPAANGLHVDTHPMANRSLLHANIASPGPVPFPNIGRLHRNVSSGFVTLQQQHHHTINPSPGYSGNGGVGGGVVYVGGNNTSAMLGQQLYDNQMYNNSSLSNTHINNLLKSVLKSDQQVDFENEFYWLDLVSLHIDVYTWYILY